MALQNTRYGAETIETMMAGCRSVFFIGIGGISMSALARMSGRVGFAVGGSDRGESELIEKLRGDGIPVFHGHDKKNLAGYDAVVYTLAIGAENPEYLAAKEAGLPLISRADYLGWLMTRYQTRIGVAGMHGKSSCTAMIAKILLEAGDPTVLCGAELPEFGNLPCRIGEAKEHFLFEACEYMDSFLDFSPTFAVILNIGMDHVDYFHSMEHIHASFRAFAAKTNRYGGRVLFNADDDESVKAMELYDGRKLTFGIDRPADYRAENLRESAEGSVFDVNYRGSFLVTVRMPKCGRHYVYNALAATAAAHRAGVEPEIIARALADFKGANRRMERKGNLNGAVVFDDYAHHPDEIRATLAGARKMGFARVLCAYQPHTFSRTAGLFREFSEAFADADKVYFADVYAAREQNTFGVTSETLAEAIGEKAVYCGTMEATANALRAEAREGDLVLVMGAGDIFKVFPMLGM